jgi:hypothetical protein
MSVSPLRGDVFYKFCSAKFILPVKYLFLVLEQVLKFYNFFNQQKKLDNV